MLQERYPYWLAGRPEQPNADLVVTDKFTGEPATRVALADTDASHGDESAEAHAMRNDVVPAMDALREAVDGIELMVDDDLWPLPKYREMMFIQ